MMLIIVFVNKNFIFILYMDFQKLTGEEINLLKAEYEYELETLEEIIFVLKDVISSRSPVFEEVIDCVSSLIPYYEEKLSEVEYFLRHGINPYQR